MTVGVAAMLLGVFGIPLGLLWVGHRLRRRSDRVQAAFWGGVTGHIVAVLIGTVAAMTPPEAWLPADRMRGALALWSFLVLPLLGAGLNVLRAKALSLPGRQP